MILVIAMLYYSRAQPMLLVSEFFFPLRVVVAYSFIDPYVTIH